MGFVGNVLRNEIGIQWYYTIGLLIFLSLFVIIVYRTVKMPKSDLLTYKQSILDDGSTADASK